MFNKYFLLNKIVNILEKKEFNTFTTKGCFDIAARREYILLVKILVNIDALNKEHALSLHAISYFLSAYPFLVSIKNNREFLSDRIVYSRFSLPVVTPKLFEEILVEEAVAIQSAKGRYTEEINSFSLREKRKECGYTLAELSEIVGITKKALYEIENKRVNPSEETVKKLEDILGIKLGLAFEMKTSKPVHIEPKDEFQKKVSKEFARIGMDNSAVHSAPFEIVGRKEFSLITSLSKNTAKIRKDACIIRRLSDIFSSYAVFVAKKSREKSMEGIPIFLEKELSGIGSSKEFADLLLEKEA